jgi:type IV secretion system protein VirB8
MLSKLPIKKKNNTGETEQKNWYIDRYQSVVVQRNMLSVFSLVALVFSTIAIFLVYSNIPIVTVEPFVIQVQPKSGMTQVVNPQTSEELTGNQSINQFFIVRYIKARESIDGALPFNFEAVRLMSEAQNVFRQYSWEVNQNNPDSYLAKSRGTGIRVVKIRSIQRMDQNPNCVDAVCAVQVRVTITESDRNNTTVVPVTLNQIITLEYMFTNVNLTIEERYVNPLGFRVLSYQKTTENM